MSVLNLNSIEKSYGITEVLKEFSLFVNDRERVGLIGPNGSGKTTVFKIITGIETYTKGNLSIGKDLKVGYLSQIPDFNEKKTLYQELENIYQDLVSLENEMRKLEKRIAEKGQKHGETNQELKKIMDQYSKCQHLFEQKGGYQYESKIRQVASGMGFSLDELYEKDVTTLSGGEKTRLGLVQLLLTEPDILLLDEPTNHLDLQSIQWLEDYLRDYQGAVIIISHDRYFLDQVVNRIVEIKNGKNEDYPGNYSYYLEERKRRYEQLRQAFDNQQKKIKKMEEAIKRLHNWGKQGDNEKFFKRARSMQKALDKIERLDKPILDGKQIQLDLAVSKRSGREVLHLEGVEKSFEELDLLSNLDFDLYWGEKAAIIGKNGTGKTTIIKMIIGEVNPDQGQIKIGANVQLGYYSQEFAGFNPEDDLITALRRECYMSTAEARNALAAFLFTEDEVFKRVDTLSGGEKSRLRLLQLMNGNYNFLILDEPTNHLDLPSREVLEETLRQYPGTILVISHDRYFLNKFIDYTYELEDKRLSKYYGNYNYYWQKKREIQSAVLEDSNQQTTTVARSNSNFHQLKEEIRQERIRKNKFKRLEEEIEKTEEMVKNLEKEMVQPDNLDNISLLNQLKEKYDETNNQLKKLYQRWEEYI